MKKLLKLIIILSLACPVFGQLQLRQGGTPSVPFKMVDETDGETAETGLSPACEISKDGTAFASTTNSASEVGNGWYEVALTGTETNTKGYLAIRCTGTGAKEWSDYHQVGKETDTHTANAVQISGDATAADNLEAWFDDTGYNASNSTVGTVTTLTGHTAQTGDSFARLGAPAGASISADIAALPTAAEINAEVLDVINTDTFCSGISAGAPPANPTMEEAFCYMFLRMRNKTVITQTGTSPNTYEVCHYADDDTELWCYTETNQGAGIGNTNTQTEGAAPTP